MLDKTFKIIIILCIVFIASIIGSYAYFSINNNPKTDDLPPVNITVQNSSSTTSTSISTKTNLISSQRAIDIVQQSNPNKSAKIRFSAKLVQNNGAPYYLVTVYDNDPTHSTYHQGIGGAKVDARTGVILDEMG